MGVMTRPIVALLAALLLIASASIEPASAAGPSASAAGPSATRVDPTQPLARVVRHGSRGRPVVALTFDDCRDREPLLALYRTLRREGVAATFFPYGYAVRRMPDAWRLVAAAGFPIGDHTLSHADLAILTDSAARYQLRAWRRVVDSLGIPSIPYARPPYGRYTNATRRAAAAEGLATLILWDVDARDWSGLGAAAIAGRAERGLDGSIVLMHCGPAATVAALPAIVAAYRARGFGFVTIPELIEGGGPAAGHGRRPPARDHPLAATHPVPA